MIRIKRVLSFLIVSLIVIPELVFADLEYVKCGSATGIPKPLPQMTTIVYTIFIVATPIILVGTAIYTMIKALGNKDSEEVLKAKKKIIKKFIVAAIILLIATITRFTIGQVVTNAEDRTTFRSCMKCFLYYSQGPDACEPSDTGNNVKRGFYYTDPDSDFVNDTESNRKEMEEKYCGSNYNPGQLGSKTIIMGDSRTVGLCAFPDSLVTTSDTCRDWHGVAKGGIGYVWQNNTGIPEVNKVLQADPGTRYNILNWLGVNDIGFSDTYPQGPETAADIYAEKMIEMANGDWKNHNIIMVLVIDIGVERSGGKWPLDRTNIRKLNQLLQQKITEANLSNLHYCDISYLDMTGCFWPDNLHHNSDGNNKIYNEMKTKCLGQ